MAVLPTIAEAIDEINALLQERGELVVLYFDFVRFRKIEEIYGWEKVDAVLETTAGAVQECLATRALTVARALTSFPHDDRFLVVHVPVVGDGESQELVDTVQRMVTARIEAAHGEEIAVLAEMYVGRSRVRLEPRMRPERLVYRAMREAAKAAGDVEQRERLRRIGDLKSSIRDRAVYVDFHPIVIAESGDVFGYEALARGMRRTLRNPMVMFEVAAEAHVMWELSRLCRARALEQIGRLAPGQLLFLNVEPHDFADPEFREDNIADASRIVLEITERTAIKDYPKFRERMQEFRSRGFRVAVDDAGSGYAGLGSIANLEPDFIKLDSSLISGIDTSATKRNLVETMVRFANEQDAKMIAEGVERAEEFAVVQGLGVHLVQGFFVNRSTEVMTYQPAVPPMSRSTRDNERRAAPRP